MLDDLPGFEFEDLIEDMFRNLGYENVRQAERTADEGRDVLIEEVIDGTRRAVIVESRYTDTVSRPVCAGANTSKSWGARPCYARQAGNLYDDPVNSTVGSSPPCAATIASTSAAACSASSRTPGLSRIRTTSGTYPASVQAAVSGFTTASIVGLAVVTQCRDAGSESLSAIGQPPFPLDFRSVIPPKRADARDKTLLATCALWSGTVPAPRRLLSGRFRVSLAAATVDQDSSLPPTISYAVASATSH